MIHEIFNIGNYTFTIYSFFPALVATLSILMAFAVLLHENFSKLSKAFAFLLLFNAPLWFYSHALFISGNDPAISLFWIKIQHFGFITIPNALLYFTLTVRKRFEKYRYVFWGFMALTLGMLYIALFTDILIVGVKRFFWGNYSLYGKFSYIFIPVFSLMLYFNLYLFWKGTREAKTKSEKQRMKFFMYSLFIASLATVDFVPDYNITLYPFGYLPIFIFLILLAMGVWKYNLVDITPELASVQIINTMNDILIITETNGFIQLMNPAAEKFFTQPERTAVNKHISELIQDPLLKTEDLGALADKISDYEITFRANNDEKRVFNLSVSHLHDGSLKTIGLIFTARDRTDYKNAQENIKRLYKTTQRILENLPVGIMILGKNKKIKDINRTALKMLVLDKEQPLPDEDICFKKMCAELNGRCPILNNQEDRFLSETILITENKNIPLYKRAIKTMIKGEEVILEAFIDITHSKELQDQLENYKDYLEQQIQERTGKLQDANKQLLSEVNIRKEVMDSLNEKVRELEKFREETMRRENEMIEIKKVINELSEELQIEPPYKLSFLRKRKA